MRLWSLHPKYLDPAGLVALWRETLLARAVLSGATRGYQYHPQLDRFRATRDPVATVDRYLAAIHAESVAREYNFDATKFVRRRSAALIAVTDAQLVFEWVHLKRKLRVRHPASFRRLGKITEPEPHPIFRVISGSIADWERP